jgi:hypothetical protein
MAFLLDDDYIIYTSLLCFPEILKILQNRIFFVVLFQHKMNIDVVCLLFCLLSFFQSNFKLK